MNRPKLACDMWRCASGDACPLGSSCLRHLDEGEDCYRVSMMAPTPSAGCPSYIPAGGDTK